MSPHASDPDPFEVAHIVARFAGEEGHDHPRQRVVRWLEDHGHHNKVAEFNEAYKACARLHPTWASWAAREALTALFGYATAHDIFRTDFADTLVRVDLAAP